MEIPCLETERLLLKIPDESFSAKMAEFVSKNREFTKASMPTMNEEYFTEIYWAIRLKNAQETAKREEGFSFVMFLKGDASETPIGQITFDKIVRGALQACYLGYKIDEDFEGRGLASEGVKRGARFMFDEIKLHRIMAGYLPTNERSARLLNKLGFRIEGYAKNYLFLNGKWEDHILTAITNENYSI